MRKKDILRELRKIIKDMGEKKLPLAYKGYEDSPEDYDYYPIYKRLSDLVKKNKK
jgi:hypothetical protein